MGRLRYRSSHSHSSRPSKSSTVRKWTFAGGHTPGCTFVSESATWAASRSRGDTQRRVSSYPRSSRGAGGCRAATSHRSSLRSPCFASGSRMMWRDSQALRPSNYQRLSEFACYHQFLTNESGDTAEQLPLTNFIQLCSEATHFLAATVNDSAVML